MLESVSVRVPATSANLGPGFDCLGLALDIWGTIRLTTDGSPYGEEPMAHMAMTAAQRVFAKASMTSPAGLSARYEGDIPIARGLGASAVAHGQPVPLLHVGLVVLLVGAAPGEPHARPPAPVVQGVVDELAAVVRVQLAQDERKPPVNLMRGGACAAHSSSPDRLQFSPACGYVNDRQRRQKEPFWALSAMENEVRLAGARLDVLHSLHVRIGISTFRPVAAEAGRRG